MPSCHILSKVKCNPLQGSVAKQNIFRPHKEPWKIRLLKIVFPKKNDFNAKLSMSKPYQFQKTLNSILSVNYEISWTDK